MNAVISWPASGSRILVDVSVRSAASARYQRCGASQRGGVAAQQGDREKEARYGQAVWPCILEARGRLSQGGRAVLQRLVLDSKTYGKRMPGRAPGMCPRALRTSVEFAVLRAVADRALRSQNAARQSSASVAIVGPLGSVPSQERREEASRSDEEQQPAAPPDPRSTRGGKGRRRPAAATAEPDTPELAAGEAEATMPCSEAVPLVRSDEVTDFRAHCSIVAQQAQPSQGGWRPALREIQRDAPSGPSSVAKGESAGPQSRSRSRRPRAKRRRPRSGSKRPARPSGARHRAADATEYGDENREARNGGGRRQPAEESGREAVARNCIRERLGQRHLVRLQLVRRRSALST